MFRFRLKTALVLTALFAAISAIYRGDPIAVIGGLGVLFAVFVFAEDIWSRFAR